VFNVFLSVDRPAIPAGHPTEHGILFGVLVAAQGS